MKKMYKILFAFVMFFVGIGFVNAKVLNMDTDVSNNSYVIGTHIFTNKGPLLTMKRIMLTSKTITSDNADDMIIYYKDIYGNWIDATTGESIQIESTKTITHIDLKEIDGLTIIFNSNGGTGTMNDQIVPIRNTDYLTVNAFEKDGYVFKYWNTKADGTGDTYYDLEYITNEDSYATLNLYAQWSPLESIITFKDLSNLNVNYDKSKIFVIKSVNDTIAWFTIEEGHIGVYQKTGIQDDTPDYEHIYVFESNKWNKYLFVNKERIYLESVDILSFKNYRVLSQEDAFSELVKYKVIRLDESEFDHYELLSDEEINQIITVSYE